MSYEIWSMTLIGSSSHSPMALPCQRLNLESSLQETKWPRDGWDQRRPFDQNVTDTPSILRIAADRAKTFNPGLHGHRAHNTTSHRTNVSVSAWAQWATDRWATRQLLWLSAQKTDGNQTRWAADPLPAALPVEKQLTAPHLLAGRKFSLKQNSIQARLRSHSEGGQWDHWSGASRNREDCFADPNWDTL